jgi:predicted Ser/Thr protein kinase
MYPTSPQYRHSIVNKTYPPDNGGRVFTPILENDEPKYESGNKAIVFKVTDDKTEKTKALKLFLIDNKERFIQYLEISKFLNKFSTQFFVSFNFIEKFIYVDVNPLPEDNYFPGLIMEWAEGKTLGSKIQELCTTKSKSNLKKIAESFKELSLFLLNNNIGHGDLKHDNIIVGEDNKMKLIDYDGIYVPAFNNQISKELGTDSFQHPQRKSADFNSDIDHFSILTIYCSLIALSANPDLYLKFNDQQNLLFTKEDFLKPGDSELFKVLTNNTETKALAFYIKQSLASESIYIDNLKDLLNGKFPKPSIEISHSPTTPLIGQKIKISWKNN